MSTTRCAVLGKPIAHSLSPVLHRAAYDALDLSWTYDAIEMDEDGLPEFLADLDASWRGLSLTMPLKRSVMQLLDSVSPIAGAAGSVNTVLLGDGLRIGDNTDVPGAAAAIRERYDGRVRTAVVVGGGATAASVALALGELGCWVATLLVRDAERAAETVQRVTYNEGPLLVVGPLEGEPLEADIVVSTIPAEAQTPDLVDRLAGIPVVFDVVYATWPTPLARSVGPDRTLVSGLDMLVHQAALQVALMTGPAGDPDRRDAGCRRAGARRAVVRLSSGENGPEEHAVALGSLRHVRHSHPARHRRGLRRGGCRAGRAGARTGRPAPRAAARPGPSRSGEAQGGLRRDRSRSRLPGPHRRSGRRCSRPCSARCWDGTGALVYLVPLTPLAVVLSVIDWRTKLLPTRLLVPAYLFLLPVLARARAGHP
jgi:shikimate dehydrogenase